MKKLFTILAALIVTGGTAYAEMDHQHGHNEHKMEHTPKAHEMKPEKSMSMPGGMEMHGMEIDGHKVNFHIMDRKAFRKYMDDMGHTTHKMKEGMSHYVMLDITGPDGKKIKRAKVKLKVITPGKKEEEKVAFPMMGSFGAEFDMAEKGKYQVMTLFKIKEDNHHGGFRHEMK